MRNTFPAKPYIRLDEQDDEFKIVGPISDEYELTRQDDAILPAFREIDNNAIISIQCYEDDLNEQTLQDTAPRFIILFDPNPAFVRQIEVYRALHPSIQIRVYFMLYENSVEEQNYLSLIRKEKEAFEKLIHEKSVSESTCVLHDVIKLYIYRSWRSPCLEKELRKLILVLELLVVN